MRQAFNETKSSCGEEKGARSWKYCVTPGTGAHQDTVIYYFHGGGGNERNWIDPHNYTKEIRKTWSEKKFDTPTVVTVSFGGYWLLAAKNKQKPSGLYEVYRDEVMPKIEKTILPRPPKERWILGESMGGFNGGSFGLREPQLFTKMALVCPGVGIGGGLSKVQLDDYVKQTGAHRWYAERIFEFGKTFFDTPEEAAAQSPLALLQNFDKKANPQLKLFLSCGRKDEYGFFKSSENFVKTAQDKGLSVEWHPVDGGHCSLDTAALAAFLMN